MVRFYIRTDDVTGDTLKVTGESFHYLKNVLRVRKGEELKAFDGTGKEYICQVVKVHPRHIDLHITEIFDVDTEPLVEICLVQSLIKAKYFEFAVQKCTELGVKKFIPVVTERTVVRLEGKRAENRRLRWKKIAVEAAKQCGRSFYPEVEPVTGFENALKLAQTQDMSIIPWEEEAVLTLKKVLIQEFQSHSSNLTFPSPASGEGRRKEISIGKKNKPAVGRIQEVRGHLTEGDMPRKVAVFIGPEGGFSSREVSLAKKSGVIPVSLGPRLLRSETAAIAAAAVLIHELG